VRTAHDNNGNTITNNYSSGITTYAWGFENQLTSATLPGTGGTVSFKYDPFGRRIYKSSLSGTSIFAYDRDNLIEETNSSGAAVARYSQDLNIDEPLAMLRSGATSFYNADGIGSITSLSNPAGALTQAYTFDSFGKQTASSGSLVNPFQYTGREFDPETGLYYYRTRYYDYSIGRFYSEDPSDQGSLYELLNLYGYVQNGPIDNVDPFGLYTLQRDRYGKVRIAPPSAVVDLLLKCIENRTGLRLVVTSTWEAHPASDSHTLGLAVDISYPSAPNAVLNAAACCGAQYAQDEKKNPSANATGPHIHLSLTRGRNGGRGDLPAQPKCCSK